MRKLAILALLICSLLAAASAQAQVKNVIIFISDGWGENLLDATAYWNGERQVYQTDPSWTYYGMSNYSFVLPSDSPPYGDGSFQGLHGYDPVNAWGDWAYMQNYATDSAAAATAMSCGEKTYNAAVGYGFDANLNRISLPHAFEAAVERGKATGVVTSVTIPHATPASFVAHEENRNNYAAIALDMLGSEADVVMGCGHPLFNDNAQPVPADPNNASQWRYVGGYAAWQDLVNGTAGGANPWQLIETESDFDALASGDIVYDRVWGVAQVRETLQYNRAGNPGGNSTQPPYAVPFNANVPTLETMTRGALNVLAQNPAGFFVMVEGGAVDWAGHGRTLGRAIEEQDDFDASVDAAIAWVEANSNWNETVIIVTGDHETGCLWGPGVDPADPTTWFTRPADLGAGVMPGFNYYTSGHTNQIIPFYVKGVYGDLFANYADEVDPVWGQYIDNTEVAHWMIEILDQIVINEPVVEQPSQTLPGAVVLHENFPNPFNPLTNIQFDLPRASQASLRVVDLSGRLVRTLNEGTLPAGTHTIQWDGTDASGQRCASGTYCYQLVTDDRVETKKMTLVK